MKENEDKKNVKDGITETAVSADTDDSEASAGPVVLSTSTVDSGEGDKMGPGAVKCLLGLVLVVFCFHLMSSCNRQRAVFTFNIGPAPGENLGSQYYAEGKYQEAVDYYQEMADDVIASGKQLDPKYSGLFYNLGIAYYKLGEYDQAVIYLDKCAGMDERTGKTEELAWDCSIIGEVYMEAGNLEESLKYYQKGLKAIRKACGKDSEDAAAFMEDLGNAYKKNEEYDKAIENYEQAMKIHENNGTDMTWGYIRMARVYKAKEDYSSAEEYYLMAARSETADPYTNGVAYYNLGQMYYEQGESARALDVLLKALELINQNGDNDYAQAHVHSALADVYAGTEKQLDQAIRQSAAACRLIEQSGSADKQDREALEEFKNQLKEYYRTDTGDTTDDGFDGWYRKQISLP